MRLIDIDPIIERLKNAIYLGKRIGEDTANMEAVLADVEAAPTYNDDLISRQAAIDEIRTMQTYKLFAGDDMLLVDQAEAMTNLMMMPAAEPRKGKWERHYSRPNVYADLFWHCSECGYKNDENYAPVYHHFCPNCGARMEESDE